MIQRCGDKHVAVAQLVAENTSQYFPESIGIQLHRTESPALSLLTVKFKLRRIITQSGDIIRGELASLSNPVPSHL